jgi:hypothetical protein
MLKNPKSIKQLGVEFDSSKYEIGIVGPRKLTKDEG